jgi:nucleoside diphosphate kinase
VTGREPGAWAAKHAAKALLGYALDSLLTRTEPGAQETATAPSPWDAWWACYRAGLPLGATGIRARAVGGACAGCAGRAAALAATDPPGHPGTEAGPCGCLVRWATVLRAPGPAARWPPMSLSLALIKPGAPAGRVQGLLASSFEVLAARELTLTVADTRRLYPEAYGASYVADRDAYLTSGPVRVLTLRARHAAVNGKDVKAGIRGRIGGDALRNHLHMPDNPGEALADIAHFAGYGELAGLHRRYERDHAPSRLAFYRTALGISEPAAHRLPAAG